MMPSLCCGVVSLTPRDIFMPLVVVLCGAFCLPVARRISTDGGDTFPAAGVTHVFPGPALAGYVDVAATDEGAVVAFENATCSISVAVVPLGVNGSTPTYMCFNGTCVKAATGCGLSECREVCVPLAGRAFKCVGGRCVLNLGGVSKSDCAAMCVPTV